MNVTSAAKDSLDGGRGQLLLSGAILGIYINILHTVPFMLASEFFLVFALIAFSAIAIPVVAAAWSQKETNPYHKARQILKGMTASSAAFTLIYLAETIVGNYALKILTNPVQFPISRTPPTSLLVALTLTVLFALSCTSIKIKNNSIKT
jgi:hypothetical protein